MRTKVSSAFIVLTAGLIAAAPVANPSPAWAQTSSDAIVKGLLPSTVNNANRGIHLAPSSPDASAPAPAQTSPAANAAPAPTRPARPAPTTTATNAAPAPAASDHPAVDLTVEFRTGSADLTPAAVRTLTELGKALSSTALASYKFRIEGHTDTVGTPEANKELSQKRATAVVDYIVTHFNVDPGRLQAVGMGEDGLKVPTPDQTPEPRNRRVEVVNISA
jgi:outer membrane protein OmpA-like peptidoglycan-associated protein